jgi:hypothetical protein
MTNAEIIARLEKVGYVKRRRSNGFGLYRNGRDAGGAAVSPTQFSIYGPIDVLYALLSPDGFVMVPREVVQSALCAVQEERRRTEGQTGSQGWSDVAAILATTLVENEAQGDQRADDWKRDVAKRLGREDAGGGR